MRETRGGGLRQQASCNPTMSELRPSWREFFAQQVKREWTDAVLLVGCLATGLIDSAVFNVWSCFVSMQTGNTVYVGLGVTGQPLSQPYRWMMSGTSILAFSLGSFLFSRLMRWLSPLKRSTLLISSVLQVALTATAALLSSLHVIPHNAGPLIEEGNYIVLLPLFLLALQAGGQCVLSRVLGYGEVPTVVLTSGYCDLAMDPNIFANLTSNSVRNRRLMAIFIVISGAAAGGKLTQHGSISHALWLVAAVKAVMALAWTFWPHQKIELE